MAEKAMLIDTSKCTACRGCQVACKQWNELDAETTTFFAPNAGYQNPPDLSADTYALVTFHSPETAGDPEWLFRKHQCMHCIDATCVEICPSGGAQKDTDTGFVIFDEEVCIGCGLCVDNCPFEVPHLTAPQNGKSKKCFACLYPYDRLSEGEDPKPACAKTCPSGAITYGDRTTMVSNANSRKSELEAEGKTAYVYGETEYGGLHQIYVLLKPASFYDLPEEGSQMTRSRRAYLQYLRELGKMYLKKVSSF